MDNMLFALGGIVVAALIGVLFWWHELRKIERERKQGRVGDHSP